MNKVAYEVLAVAVDKLYQKDLLPTDLKGIAEHSEYIATFVEACGWTAEEFLDEYVHQGLMDLLPQNKN